jgi:hypothetical protein
VRRLPPRRSPATRDERERLPQIPAEVDLGADDLVLVVEGQDLRVASSAAPGDVGLVGHDHFVARLDQPDEFEVVTAPCSRPAPLEVAVTVEFRVRRGGEDKVFAQAPFEELSVAGRKGGVRVSGDLRAIGGDWPSLVTPLPLDHWTRT